jgi:hypothetical protein
LDGAVFDRLVSTGGVGECLCRVARIVFGASMDAHAHESCERWVTDLLPLPNFFGVEALVVMLGGQTHRRVIGLVGLKDDFSRAVGTACATGDLREQLKGPLGGAEIREGEALIGKGNTHQGDPGNIVSLGDHLRTHEHVDLAASQPIEHPLDPIPRRRIAIEPRDAGLGETLLDGFLQLFGTDPKPLELRAPARRAGNRDRPMEIAVVASKRALPPVFG